MSFKCGANSRDWSSSKFNPEKNMKKRVTRIVECIVACTGALLLSSVVQSAVAQDSANLPYMNPQLSPEQRATDLVHRMTLAEKATQMQNNSAAVPRLNVPAYQWWSEALHGVINQGVTEYPEPIGLAATFDAPGIHTMATPDWHRGTHQACAERSARDTRASWEAWISGPRI